MKKITNIKTHAAILISIPLLILGGCAGNDTVAMLPQTPPMDIETIDSVAELNERPEIDNFTPEMEASNTSDSNYSEIEISVDETEIEKIIVAKEITPKPDKNIVGFAFDQTDINAQYGEMLWQHAQYLKENKNLMITVSGHTDNSGARVYNEMLSKKRAQVVANILVEFGVPVERIKVMGNASDQPLIGAMTNRDHRRVELEFEDQQLVSN